MILLNASLKLFFSLSAKIPQLFIGISLQGVLLETTTGLPHDRASAITIPKLSNSDA